MHRAFPVLLQALLDLPKVSPALPKLCSHSAISTYTPLHPLLAPPFRHTILYPYTAIYHPSIHLKATSISLPFASTGDLDIRESTIEESSIMAELSYLHYFTSLKMPVHVERDP